jgi:hypothetical protein
MDIGNRDKQARSVSQSLDPGLPVAEIRFRHAIGHVDCQFWQFMNIFFFCFFEFSHQVQDQ